MQPSPTPQNPFNSVDIKTLIAPAGGLIALLGFFLPWIFVGNVFVGKNFAGYELGIFVWPIPLLCFGIIGTAFLPYLAKQVPILIIQVVTLGCAGLSLLLMFFRLVWLVFELRNTALVTWSIQIGFLMTGFGLVVASVGSLLVLIAQKR